MPAKDRHLWADIQAGLVREVAAMLGMKDCLS